MRRFQLFYVLPTLALLGLACLPLISGSGTLYSRDVLNTHLPLKLGQAEALRQGELPLVDLHRGAGQPLIGNLNGAPLYPTNLLHLAASPLWALNAHFWLHWLLAPLAFFWLARAWGLSPPSAWAAGACYATSGYFLSQLNLFNLVAGTALAPAFAAALISAWCPDRFRPWRLPVVALLWCLLLLAGDPLLAGLALLLGVSGGLMRHRRRPAASLRLASSLALGTALAAPQIVELLRALPLSYRGHWGYSLRGALAQSWNPGTAAEWLLPLFFGSPDFSFWGQRFYEGNPPLFYSLYPGILTLCLMALAGRARKWAGAWSWMLVASGLFLAAGAWNPIVRALYTVLPGASALRYPIKLWLLVAVGGALLAGLGFERLQEPGRRRALAWLLAGFAALYLLLAALMVVGPAAWMNSLRSLAPERLAGGAFDEQRVRWALLCFLSFATAALLALILRLSQRRPYGGGALLLAIHVGAQCALLQPLFDSDASEHYTRRPALADAVEATDLVVHGGSRDLFGKQAGNVLDYFPDHRAFWLERAYVDQLYPFSGIQQGFRYAFNFSPEGLDSFLGMSLAQAVARMDDPSRLSVVEASGGQVLILDRELEGEAAKRVELLRRSPGALGETHAYRLPGAAPRVALLGRIRRAEHMNAALGQIADPGFDARTTAVLPGPAGSPTLDGPPGEVEILREVTERLEVRARSPAGGVLVVQRSYLPHYRARVDGQEAAVGVANLHRIGIEVPAGEHRIELWVDRRPFHRAWLLALVAAAGLALIAREPKQAGAATGRAS